MWSVERDNRIGYSVFSTEAHSTAPSGYPLNEIAEVSGYIRNGSDPCGDAELIAAARNALPALLALVLLFNGNKRR